MGKHKSSSDSPFEGDPVKIANDFNEFIVNKPKNLLNNLPNKNYECNLASINTRFTFKEITESEIKTIINNLKNKNSAGYDEISNNLIKKCVNEISEPLCFLVNNSLKHATFPNSLKLAIIILLYKKGNHEDMSNYRPLSLLSCFSKIFEYAACNQLIEYFNDNKLFCQNQNGYLRGKSTATAIYAFTEKILEAHESSNMA